jgi:hypothetical protein
VNHRPPGFQQETQKIQVLHSVSLKNQKAILSLPQYRFEPAGNRRRSGAVEATTAWHSRRPKQ